MSFVAISPEDYVISSESVVRGLWDGDQNTLFSPLYLTNDLNAYALNVHKDSPSGVPSSPVQFTIQYGHINGLGSNPVSSNAPQFTPTRITYGQYRSQIYGSEESQFVFNGVASNDFFAISIARSQFRESIRPASLNFSLKNGANIIYLTDDSKDALNTNFIGTNRYYNLVRGTNGKQTVPGTNPLGGYGFLFPDLGLIIINPQALTSSVANGGIGLTLAPSNAINANNPNPNIKLLFNCLNNAGQEFKLQSQETISSIFFFIRVKNGEFNYTTNPSIIDNNGNILYPTLIDNPQTYITTVGFYNDNSDLIATAKINKPLIKDYTKELLLKVKMSF